MTAGEPPAAVLARVVELVASVARGSRAPRPPQGREVPVPAIARHRPVVVGIDGRSGSGKTRLAAELAQALCRAPALTRSAVTSSHAVVPVVHLDDLYPGWSGLDDGVRLLRSWVLEPFAQGREARCRRYDWSLARFGPWRSIPITPVVVVEGVGCGSARHDGLIDVLVWVEAGEDVRRDRVGERDGPLVLAHWDAWADQEERQLAREGIRELADVVVDGEAGSARVGSARFGGTKVP